MPASIENQTPIFPARGLHPLTCLCRTHCTVGWVGVWTSVVRPCACTAPGCSGYTPVGPSPAASCSLPRPLSIKHSDTQTFSVCFCAVMPARLYSIVSWVSVARNECFIYLFTVWLADIITIYNLLSYSFTNKLTDQLKDIITSLFHWLVTVPHSLVKSQRSDWFTE
jgi:hypothetical protein